MNVFCKQGRYNKLLSRMINDEGNTLFRKCWYYSITLNVDSKCLKCIIRNYYSHCYNFDNIPEKLDL